MAGSINDKITDSFNSANPNVAKVTAGRTAGAATLVCDNLAGWPTSSTSAVHFSTYKIDTNNNLVAGTQIDWKGLVSGNSIGSLTRKAGATDAGNAIGDVVEMNITGSWGHDLFTGFTQEHNQLDGTHKAITATSLTVSGLTTHGSNVIVPNNTAYQAKQAGGTVVDLMKLSAGGTLRLAQINNRQGTTNTLQPLLIQTGWDRTQGTSSNRVDKTITFPETFDTLLGVTVTYNGSSAADPVTIAGSTGTAAAMVGSNNTTTSQFVASVFAQDGAGNLGTTWYSYTWIAIGIKA